MGKTRIVQINDADYGDSRVVVELECWVGGKRDWARPAWEEMGLPELDETFASRADALAAVRSVERFFPEYGFEFSDRSPLTLTIARDELKAKIASDPDTLTDA